MKCVIGLLVLQLLTQCRSRGMPDESVISYQKPGNESGDVYFQIATNLAEKITTPLYSFFGFANRTGSIFKKRWNAIETLDESKEVTHQKPVIDDLEERDVEQISLEALQKEVKKPEKIYLLPKENSGRIRNVQFNDSYNEVDSKELMDDDTHDADFDEKPKESGFVYFLELAGSFFQLVFGALVQLFNPSRS